MSTRVARIFISSTFRDMAAERDHLVRQVFPSLRARLAPLDIQVLEVDLRWGITAENNNIAETCLKAVEECLPFFIGLLGQRYGTRLSQLAMGDSSGSDKSLMELEIDHLLAHREHTSLGQSVHFYYRDPSYLRFVNADCRHLFLDETAEQCDAMRSKLVAAGIPIKAYPCNWDPRLQTQSVEAAGGVVDLDIFGDMIQQDLFNGITSYFSKAAEQRGNSVQENHHLHHGGKSPEGGSLSDDERLELVEATLSQFSKFLDPSQLEIIFHSEATHDALFLSAFLEELRLFGSFEGLSDFMNTLLSCSKGDEALEHLFTHIFKRLARDVGAPLLDRILCMVLQSQHGLTETELESLVEDHDGNKDLYVVLRYLRPYLQGSTSDGALRVHLDHHAGIKRAARARWRDHPEFETKVRKIMAGFFRDQPSWIAEGDEAEPNRRKLTEAPYLLRRCEDWHSLTVLYTTHSFLDAFINAESAEALTVSLRKVLEVMPAEGHQTRHRVLGDLLRVVEENAALLNDSRGLLAVFRSHLQKPAVAESADEPPLPRKPIGLQLEDILGFWEQSAVAAGDAMGSFRQS